MKIILFKGKYIKTRSLQCEQAHRMEHLCHTYLLWCVTVKSDQTYIINNHCKNNRTPEQELPRETLNFINHLKTLQVSKKNYCKMMKSKAHF